ncbi:chalcone isomerase family protein [Simplicispira suum]|uniref:chalcone isomerase family protein n=1 Tax=Simplicispira suum TaxID=2109915 RepID=UPI001FEAA343|nr:chalcone isomerase family protein [Simplicispira suum]
MFFFGTALASAAADAPLAGAQLSGRGTLRFLGLEVYQATLWVRPGFAPTHWAQHALALELRYARGFSAEAIAQRSIEEMQRQQPVPAAQAARWQAELAALLPDVAAGDRLVGVYAPGEGARFVYNDKALESIDDPLFARLFFGIWLSPQSSEPTLRAALLAAP